MMIRWISHLLEHFCAMLHEQAIYISMQTDTTGHSNIEISEECTKSRSLGNVGSSHVSTRADLIFEYLLLPSFSDLPLDKMRTLQS